MKGKRGYFITFESTVEGIGKTTQSKRLAERLRAEGYDVVWTREPGGTAIGQVLREIVLHEKGELSRAAELLLITADRAQHYKEVLKPALKAGKIVVCDRYLDSTLAYQGSARGWKTAFLWRLHHAATGGLLPDLTLVLDGHSFREQANDDRFEHSGHAFFQRVKRGMLHLTTKADRYVLMDVGDDSIDAVGERIWMEVSKRLAERAIPKPSTPSL